MEAKRSSQMALLEAKELLGHIEGRERGFTGQGIEGIQEAEDEELGDETRSVGVASEHLPFTSENIGDPGDVSGIEDDFGFDGASQGFYSEEGEEEEDDFEGDLPEGVQERDRLLHWWCLRQLHRCLRKLQRADKAGPFLEPVPWEELELDDYLEVVETPMDLRTIGERLDKQGYEDTDGLINPELFWSDVALCWDNCMKYYEDDEDLEAYRMALEMAEAAEALEDGFWEELEAFEQNINEVDPTLGGVAAAMDVAAGTVEEMATVAYDQLAKSLGGWWTTINTEVQDRIKREKKLDFGKDEIRSFEADYDPDGPSSVLDYQFYRTPPPLLREHFGEILLSRYRQNVIKELEDIELSITTAINDACKFLDERDEEREFDLLRQKIPLTRLFPGLCKVSRAKQKPAPRRASNLSAASAKSLPKPRRHAQPKDGSSEGSRPSTINSRWRRNSSSASSKSASSRSNVSADSRSSSRRSPNAKSKGSNRTSSDSRPSNTSRPSNASSNPSRGVSSNTLSAFSSSGRPVLDMNNKNDPRVRAILAKVGDDDEDDKSGDPTKSIEVGKLKALLQKRKKKPVG